MATPEQFLQQAIRAVRTLTDERSLARKRRKRQIRRVIRAVVLMVLVTFIFIPVMIAAGFMLGPRGVEGLIAAPVVLLAAWYLIYRFTFRPTPTPQLALKAGDLTNLSEQTEAWISEQRPQLPWPAQNQLGRIAERVENMAPQLRGVTTDSEPGSELRRLLTEELPQLVQGYSKVPKPLRARPLYDGPSPEQQLTQGLDTLERQLGRLQERLAKEDLHALATHHRYLQSKYGPEEPDQK